MITIKYVSEQYPFAKATPGAAGYDLYTTADKAILPGKFTMVPTGVRVSMPPGVCAKIVGRSGLAKNNGFVVGGGLIDSDYRGEIHVLLSTIEGDTADTKKVKAGERVAQLIFIQLSGCDVEKAETLDETSRGEGGFGSTGSS